MRPEGTGRPAPSAPHQSGTQPGAQKWSPRLWEPGLTPCPRSTKDRHGHSGACGRKQPTGTPVPHSPPPSRGDPGLSQPPVAGGGHRGWRVAHVCRPACARALTAGVQAHTHVCTLIHVCPAPLGTRSPGLGQGVWEGRLTEGPPPPVTLAPSALLPEGTPHTQVPSLAPHENRVASWPAGTGAGRSLLPLALG